MSKLQENDKLNAILKAIEEWGVIDFNNELLLFIKILKKMKSATDVTDFYKGNYEEKENLASIFDNNILVLAMKEHNLLKAKYAKLKKRVKELEDFCSAYRED